jgi:hypothetical protein
MWPGSSVAGSFGTQRSGVQISPTRLVAEGLVTGPLAASEAVCLTHWNRAARGRQSSPGWAGASGIRLCDDCGMSSDVFGPVLIVRCL